MVGPNSFTKTICSICYEDLKPIVEDLQAISVCGHVFHELCLQQWFEYCTNSKKRTCPVCKQCCTNKSVGRLYFQSIGDPQSQIETQNLNFNPNGENPEVLRREIKRLEAKVSGLLSAVELHLKDVKQLGDELHICKEQLSKEVILKNEALRQKECIQSMLQTKSNDLVKTNLECSKLQERNLALVKEITALKLVSDCNLEEEEIVKLATLGHESNTQDAIDVLKKSLVIRNKSYKELMAKCNSLGRGEARSLRKLEKAQEKILKLKTKVQELETTIEEKENQVLRSLKASKKRKHDDVSLPTINKSSEPSSVLNQSPLKQKGESPTSVIGLDDDTDSPLVAEGTNKEEASVKHKGDETHHMDIGNHDCSIQIEDEPQRLKAVDTHLKAQTWKDQSYQKEDLMRQSSPLCKSSNLAEALNARYRPNEASGLGLQDIRQVQPSFKSNIETSSSIPLAEPGNRCFTGGLLGPDGANRYLGKWCKRAQNKTPLGSSNNSDSLIAVGSDGRGGTVKVVRPFNQTPMDSTPSTSAKRFKFGVKSNGLQSQGCRQIDHFFNKGTS